MDVVAWCNRFIISGFFLLFGLVPLLLTPWNYELFEYNKMMAVYGLTILIVTAWLVKSVQQKALRVAKTALDIPIALFVGSQLVSALFSIDPHVSWLGYYSRFNGGMWSVISYVLLYYAYVTNREHIPEKKLLTVTLVTAVLVSIYGVLERLGIDKHLWVQDVQNRVFSTLGQPNWLAAYLVALIPLSFAFGLSKRPWFLASVLFFVVLLFTRSRSGLLGLFVADIIFWGLLFKPRQISLTSIRRNSLVLSFVFLHIIFALILFVNGTGYAKIDSWATLSALQKQVTSKTQESTPSAQPVGPALEVGGTESGTIRKYVWEGAINAWKSSTKTMLIGTGTETFAFAFYQHRPAGHNLTSEWDFLYNKAHNEYLNYLATTGILGLGSYVLFLGSVLFWYVKQNKKDPLLHALFAGWLSLLVTNFFGFSVVITQVFLFLLPAMMIVPRMQKNAASMELSLPRVPVWIGWLMVVAGVVTFVRVASFWVADTKYAKGYRLIRSGLYAQAVPQLLSAITLNGNEPMYRDELSSAYATLAIAAAENTDATQAGQLADLAVAASDRAISTSPHNANFYKTRTKVFYTLAALDPSLNSQAIGSLEAAATLSPNDPKIYYNIAILLGREGKNKEAISYLLKAKELKRDYRDTYYALWVFYTEEKNTEQAKAILNEYVTKIDSKDAQFTQLLSQ